MRRIAAFVVFIAGLFGACSAVIAQEAARPGAGVSGKWLVTADFNGTPLFFRMELKEEAGKLTGEFGGDKLTGTLEDKAIHFVAKDDQGGTEECTATLKDGALSGTFIFTDADDREHPETHTLLPPSRRYASLVLRSATTSLPPLSIANSRRPTSPSSPCPPATPSIPPPSTPAAPMKKA